MRKIFQGSGGTEGDSPSEERGLGGFLAELERRHVVRAGVAYAAGGFVVLQAAEILQEALGFPDWVFRLVVVFALLGFPLTLALAWVYEVTPHGVRAVGGDRGAGTWPRVALLGVTALAVVASGWWWVQSTVAGERFVVGASGSGFRRASLESGGPIRSLAVLPFESYSEQGADDYFAKGMHEALISQLSQLDFVRVLSRTSAAEYDARGKSVPQIGAELGVDAIVEGSVLRAEGRVRITVQLIEAAADAHLWAQDYERDLVEIIALQREVAEAIAREIRGELQGAQGTEVSVQALVADPLAADELLRGRMALAEGTMEAGSASNLLDSAAAHFQRAIGRDPTLAPAYSGLAQVLVMRSLVGDTGVAMDDVRRAAESVRQALAIDPGSREGREVLAHIEMLRLPEGPGSPSESFAPKAGPGADSASVELLEGEEPSIVALTEAGRQLQVALARREAGSASPAMRLRAARRLSGAGLYDQAIGLLEDVLERDPRNPQAWDELEQVHRLRGALPEVVEVWRARTRALPERAPGAPSIAELEQAVEEEGERGYWRWRLEDLEARLRWGQGPPVSSIELAACHAGLGDADAALALLERGAREGDPRIRTVRSDPVWDPLRRDPRFASALAAGETAGPTAGGPGARPFPARREGAR